MKASQTLIKTLRDNPVDAKVKSHQLMIRGGLVRSSGSGLYHFLPIGLRVFRKIENIIREQMDRSGALEFLLPVITSSDLWKKSGRWDKMGPELFRVRDRHDHYSALGPTHEESFTDLIKNLISSYKDLPLNVYQIHTKFRDEIRPRFGVIRSREFCMKDAYSFDLDEASLEITYQKMRTVYRRIFKRMGLETISVEADSGSMGGSGSEEFMVPSEIGEETLLLSEGGKYKGNQEKTPVVYPKRDLIQVDASDPSALKSVTTPNCKSIVDVADFLKAELHQTIKSVVFETADGTVFVFLQGDRDLNETKLINHLGGAELNIASEISIQKAGSVAGFIGPFDLSRDTIVLYDLSIEPGKKYIVGANRKDMHLIDFVFSNEREYFDFALARQGDLSPREDGVLTVTKGIEVGHIFKLGNKYSKCFDVSVLDPNGKAVTPVMGCYGIGINRSMATIIEQNNDDLGIIWPVSVAPYEVILIGISKGVEQEKKLEALYEHLKGAGIEILYDDRKLRPGVKFKDAELLGIPVRITAGKNYFENDELELQLRRGGKDATRSIILQNEIVETVQKILADLYDELEKN